MRCDDDGVDFGWRGKGKGSLEVARQRAAFCANRASDGNPLVWMDGGGRRGGGFGGWKE